MVRNYQNADCSIIKDFYPVNYYNFRHTFFPLCRPPNVPSKDGLSFYLTCLMYMPYLGKLKATKMAKLAVKKHLFLRITHTHTGELVPER